MTYTYTALIHKEDDRYFARVPDIAGCVTSGRSLEEAIDMITDALSGCLVVAEDINAPINPPTPQYDIKHSDDEICTLIRVDTIAYRAATDKRSVRKNVSLPAWMANLADKRGINCSKLLQDALLHIL